MKPSFAGLGAVLLAASPLAAIPLAVPLDTLFPKTVLAVEPAVAILADDLHRGTSDYCPLKASCGNTNHS